MLRRSRFFLKGDLTSVVLHDCNPQHGAPYNNHDRAMRDEEFQAFLSSVKGWTVLESGAIHRTFEFSNYKLAYEWMGRLFAYSYVSDKYPKLHWQGTHVEVTIYSGRFHGITRREARLAAFMNDHFNLLRKAQVAQKEHLEASKKVNMFSDGQTPLIMELSKGPKHHHGAGVVAGVVEKEEAEKQQQEQQLNMNERLNPAMQSIVKNVSHGFASDSYALAAMLEQAQRDKANGIKIDFGETTDTEEKEVK
jgi:pterin-4a-carbinolamine dehydratase